MLQQPRRSYSFEELQDQVQRLQEKHKRLVDPQEQRAYSTQLISFSTSLAIVFLQEGLVSEAEFFIQAATAADAWLSKHGTLVELTWQNRPLPYLLSSYLNLKLSNFQNLLIAPVYSRACQSDIRCLVPRLHIKSCD